MTDTTEILAERLTTLENRVAELEKCATGRWGEFKGPKKPKAKK